MAGLDGWLGWMDGLVDGWIGAVDGVEGLVWDWSNG